MSTQIPGFHSLTPLRPGPAGQRFAAFSEQLQRQVVLEVLPAAVLADPAAARRDAEHASTFVHPTVATPLLVASLPDGGFCMAFEPLEGATLAEVLAQRGPMIADDALLLFGELSGGLMQLHQAGVVHGDVRPENIHLLGLGTSHRPRLVVQTRGPLVARDIDLLREFRSLRVNVSVPTDSERVRARFEPKAPPIDKRWDALHQLKDAGIAVGVCVTPTLPVEDAAGFAARIAALAPAVLVCQDFHDSGGGFGANTGAGARRLLAEIGWGPADYRRFVDRLRENGTVYEGEAGFFPPPTAAQ